MLIFDTEIHMLRQFNWRSGGAIFNAHSKKKSTRRILILSSNLIITTGIKLPVMIPCGSEV